MPADTDQLMVLKTAVKTFENDLLPKIYKDLERARLRMEFLIDHSTLTQYVFI